MVSKKEKLIDDFRGRISDITALTKGVLSLKNAPKDKKITEYVSIMHDRVLIQSLGKKDYDILSSEFENDIFWNTYQDLLEYLENKYC